MAVDLRLGTWDDARWIGRIFGIDPAAVVAEGHRLLTLCDAAEVATAEEQDAVVQQELRLRPTKSAIQVQRAIADHPHRLSLIAMAHLLNTRREFT